MEASNESGYPDVAFVLRDGSGEGTIELKFSRTKTPFPNLRALLRGNQKASLLEYFAAGGRRRFCLCYHMRNSHLYDTETYVRAVLGRGDQPSSCMDIHDETQIGEWLARELRQ